MLNKTPSPPRARMVALSSALVLGLMIPTSTAAPVHAAVPAATAALDPSATRFLQLWNKIHDPANGYFSPEGAPYHSIETLICEAPDQGHETTSEAYSYWLWLEAVYGRITGDWSYFRKAWTTMETQIIPGAADQPNAGAYGTAKPATYAAEWSLPSYYPSQLRTDVPVGQDPVSAELTSTYGDSYVYGMHWLLDCDNFYGFGNRGDGVSKPSYINTFQRGEQESVWETVPQPSWDAFNWGGSNGYLDLFVKDISTPARQWKYTNAPDADARAIQALYWAMVWVKAQGKDPAVELPLAKGSKMGDYLRLAMFDKYFKPIGIQSENGRGGTGYESAHYLMSWYYAWGGPTPPGSGWAWRIGCSHSHFGYQNPMTAWALSSVPELTPKSPSAAADWKKSLDRQLELYQWLQSAEGAIAGGATNSYNGNYSPYPAGTPTFYGMAYQEAPVYHDPPSNQWFGMQAWSMERLAEFYYQTNNARAKSVLDKWIPWVKASVTLTADGSYAIPSELTWTGKPETWVPAAPVANTNLHVAVKSTTQDVGVTGSLVKALLYYSAATSKWTAAPDDASRNLGKELLDRMWSFSDSKGIATVEKRGDYKRFFDPVHIPSGWSGKMPNGDVISPGVRFIDIRSNYLKDPEFAAVKAAVDAGVDYQATYHRFWAQADIATAYGVYSTLFDSAFSVDPGSLALPSSATTKTATVTTTGAWTAVKSAAWLTVTPASGTGSGTLTIAATANTATTARTATITVTSSGGTRSIAVSQAAAPTVPPVPTGLAATAGDAKVTLSWTASSGATSYNVYRGTTAGGEAATPIATGLATPSYANTGLTNGTTYYYKVAAVNTAGTSALSAEVSATPKAAVVIPAVPTGLAATAGDAKVTLSWTASSGATSYNVYRGTTAGGEAATPIATGLTTPSYVNTGLTNGTKYYYKVAAVNSAGTSALSAEVSATPKAAVVIPPVPTGLAATAGDAKVTLSWTASSGARSYNVYRGTTAGGEAATPIATGLTTPSYINTGLTNGTKYYYKVAAVNSAGTSARSAEVSATPKATVVIPPVPTGLAATAGDAKVTLSWTASTGARSYNVYRGTTAGGEAATPIATGLTTPSYINTGLTNGTKYYYKVAAVSSAGTSARSAEVSATPMANTSGPVTAKAAQSSSSGPWWGENDLTLTSTGAVTAMTVTITVQKTTGVSYNGQYNTMGQFSQTHSETASTIVYTFTLNAGQTFGTGSYIFAAQYGGTGTAHAATGDTYTVSYSSGGMTYALNGHF